MNSNSKLLTYIDECEEIKNNAPSWATHYLKHFHSIHSKYLKETSTHFTFFECGRKWSFTKSHMSSLGEIIKL